MALAQIGQPWGLFNATSGWSGTALNLNASTTRVAMMIVPLLGGTLSKVRIWVSSVTGTIGSSDLTCELYDNSAGAPGSLLQSSSTVTAAPTGASWVEFTGFSTALTIGTEYWFVLKNNNGTPASNFVVNTAFSNFPGFATSSNPAFGQYLYFTSTDSGSSWTRTTRLPQIVLDYGSSNVEGFPFQTVSTSAGQIYSSREYGLRFVSPSNATMNIIGIGSLVLKTASPTGNLRYRLYTGSSTTPTLQGTTVTAAPGEINGSREPKPLYFSTPISITAGTTVRIVVSETTQSDTSSNRYTLEEFTLSSTDTGILVPYTTQPQSTLSTDGGANFTDTDNRLPAIWPILDAQTPFSSSGGGGTGGSFTFIG